MQTRQPDQIDRRAFLQKATLGASALSAAMTPLPRANAALLGSPKLIHPAPLQTVRVGFVGVGDRGTHLLKLLLEVEAVEVRAVCDVKPDRANRARDVVERITAKKPETYSTGERDYERLCAREDLDLVITATPWQLHVPVCLAALRAGKHAATEVPACHMVEEAWELVGAAEKAGRHLIMLENYCYMQDLMCVLNLVRQGFFGKLMHAEAGYQKDARYYDLQMKPDGSLGWQGDFRKDKKGNIYPTHDIGPVAQWMDINRGDRFEYLVSIGSPAAAFNEYGAAYFGPEHYLTKTRYDMSDINVSLLKTAQGRSVYLILDTLLSRPEARNVYRLLGSKGIFDRTIGKVYLEAKSQRHDRHHGAWDPIEKYFAEFNHPLWTNLKDKTINSGHGGGDYLCLYRMIQALREGAPPDIDTYDTVTWSVIAGLSEQSARNRSERVEFPDFTRGLWKTRRTA